MRCYGLRHRVTSTRVYIYSIVIVWLVGLCMAGLAIFLTYYAKLDRRYLTVVDICLLISLLVICACYLKIRTYLRSKPAELAPNDTSWSNSRPAKRNLRFSKTMFIVIAVSLVFWLPAFVVYIIRGFCLRCFPQLVLWSAWMLCTWKILWSIHSCTSLGCQYSKTLQENLS